MHEKFPDEHHEITHNTYFGFWIYLMTDFILFATLFAVYAVLRSTAGSKEIFHLSSVLSETLILSTSGFTCALATLALPMDHKKKLVGWYGVTFLLGLCFLILVGMEFSQLIAAGETWQKNAFLSAYFTLIGTHALHIFIGLVWIVILTIQVVQWGLIPAVIKRLNCLSMFWIFSYIVWIFMYAIVYLVR